MSNYQNYGNYPYGNVYHPYNNQAQQPNYAQPNFNNNLGNMMNNQVQQTQMTQCYWVNGAEGAKAFQMIPNQTAMLMDSDNPICYMKSANSMGQSTLRYFKLIEIKESDLKNNPNNELNNDYVLKSDFEGLIKRVDELSSIIKNTQNKETEVVNNG